MESSHIILLVTIFVCLTLAEVVTSQTASPGTTATEPYIHHASYAYRDAYGTGPMTSYEDANGKYEEPPSAAVVSTVLQLLFFDFPACSYIFCEVIWHPLHLLVKS